MDEIVMERRESKREVQDLLMEAMKSDAKFNWKDTDDLPEEILISIGEVA